MTDLAIRQDGDQWDFAIEGGDFVRVDGPEEVAQRVTYRLMTWLGESVYDTSAGVPYIDGVFGAEPVPGVAQLLLEVIRKTEGVRQVLNDWTFDLADDGTLALSGTALLDTGTPIELSLSVAS